MVVPGLRAALNAGAALLGVATVDEGQVLRAHGVEAPIVLLGSIDAAEAPAACETGLEITVAGERLLESVQRARERVSPRRRSQFISSRYRTASLWRTRQKRSPWQPGSQTTHILALLAASSRISPQRTNQASRSRLRSFQEFEHAVDAVRGSGVRLPPLHVANSAGVLTGCGTEYAIARVGIALYGVPPSPTVPVGRHARRDEHREPHHSTHCAGTW